MINDRKINDVPQEIKAKLRQLKEGEAVKIRLGASWFTPVPVTMGKTGSSKTTNYKTVKVGRKSLCKHWPINVDGQVIECGYWVRNNPTTGQPVYQRLTMKDGEFTFEYGKPKHREFFEIFQLSPEYRYDWLTLDSDGKPTERASWSIDIVDPIKEGAASVERAMHENEIFNKVVALTDEQANTMMSVEMYGYNFFNQKHLMGDGQSGRQYLLRQFIEKGVSGYKDVENKLKSLEACGNIQIIHGMLKDKKWATVGTHLSVIATGLELVKYAQPLRSNPEAHDQTAKEIYQNYGKVKELLYAIEEVKTAMKAKKSSAAKAI